MAYYGLTNFVYQFTLWIARLLYLHFLWVVFTLAGLGVFGLFPATAATFSLIRIWLQDRSVPIAREFIKEYKNGFIKANKLGWSIAPVLLAVIMILRWSILSDSSFSGFISVLSVVCGLLTIFYGMFLFPVYSHYDVSMKDIYKYTFFISVSFPHYAMGMLVLCLALAYILLCTGFLIFFFSSATILIIMYGALKVFNSIHYKQLMERTE